MSGDSKSSNSPEPEVVDELEPKTKVLDIDYDDIPDSGFPLTPSSSTLRKGKIKKLHVLGDIHGWAPGLINYLISHKLASIEIDGHDLGSSGRLNDVNIRRLFGRNKTMSARELPPAGLSGRPGFMDCVNSGGHGSIKARWIARDDVGFLQIGDIFDRADHSEVAAEILRQLTIDAPNRVFTLVGNHEQFMLEGDYDSWYMNEIRNAVTDSRDTPSEWRGRHLRFMGTVDLESEQRARIVFESYRESTLLLFLTQGAVQQKMLGVDHGLTEEEIDKLLSAGWSSYQAASEIGQRFCTEGVDFPGAFIALVFGDSLFHHGEPDYRKIRLSEMMQWTDDFGWLNYIHGGGDIRNTIHSNILWSRGASSGSSSGTPNSEVKLQEISEKWPGVFRVVHGHTPTVSVDEFHGATRGKSTVVSYLAESSDRVQVPEVASQIRVYNIDEGMSPVYYVGDEEANDPSRIPLGLRVASDESRLAPVISHSKSDRVLSIDNNRDVTKDTRKLWKWKSGQNRCALTSGWHRVSNSRWIEALSFNGIEWLLETSEEGKEIFSRRVSGYDIERNVLLQLLEDANCRPSGISIAKHKPALFHLNHKGGPKHLAALQNGGESWRIAKGLQIAAIGFMLSGKKNILEVFIINGCNKREFNFTVAGETPVKHPVKALTIERLRISLSGKPVAIHDSRVKDVVDQMKRWMGSEEIKKSKQFPIIAHYPLESATASKFKIESIGKSWNFPKPKKVRKKKKSPKSESSKTTPPVIKPEPSKSESPKTTPSVIKQEPSKSESPKTTRPKAPPNMENYKPTARSTKDTVPPYPPLNVDIEGAEKGGKSGSKKQSSASSSASSSEKPKQPEPKSPTIDSAIQVELKFNSQRGFEFDIGTEDLRKMIGKKLPAKSSLELRAYRINSRALIINIETLQNKKKWTFQLKVEGDSFKQNGTPSAKRRHDGINASEAIAIFEHPEFIRLVEMGIKGDSD